MDWGGSWCDYLALTEFAYNNSYHVSIGMAPYEALHSRPCRLSLCWDESCDQVVLGLEFMRECVENVALICQRLLTSQSW